MKNTLNLKTPCAYQTYLSLGYNWAEENLLNLDEGKQILQLSDARKQSIFEFIIGRKSDTDQSRAKENDKQFYEKILNENNARFYLEVI